MKRSANFLIDDSAEATAAVLCGIMAEFMGLLRVDCYDSLNFKSGINNDRLRIALGMLIAFVKLDRRGGIFSQPVMERSVTSTVGDDEQFKKHSVEAGFDPREACGIVAYKIRVMLSHLRIKHDTCKECDDPSAFDAAYSLMKVPKDLHEQKKTRRDSRLSSSRPHPFIHFRTDVAEAAADDEEADAPDAENVEKATVVARLWDPVEYKAILMEKNE